MATSSYTWTSSAAAKTNEFIRIQTNARYLGLINSPYFPKTVAEYAQHQAEFKHDTAVGEKEKLSYKIEASAARKRGVHGVGELMGGLSLVKKEKRTALTTPTSALMRNKVSFNKGKGHEEELISDGEGGLCKKQDMKLYKPGYSKVLGLRTDIWAGNEEDLTEGKRKHNWDQQRAYWPDNAEFRAEGIGRVDAALPRRLPRPRIDSFNNKALFHSLRDTEMTVEEIKNRVRKLTNWSKDNLPIWKRQTVDFQAELDVLLSIDKERNEDKLLIQALGIEIISAHGSLAAAVGAQAKVYGLSKKSNEPGWRPSGVKARKNGMPSGVCIDIPTMLVGSPVADNRYDTTNAANSNTLSSRTSDASSSENFSTPNARGISGLPKVGNSDAFLFPDPEAPSKLGGKAMNIPSNTLYDPGVDRKRNGLPSIGGPKIPAAGINGDTNAMSFAARKTSHTLDPASHYNQTTNLSHSGQPISNTDVSTSSNTAQHHLGPIDPSQWYNVTAHLDPKGYDSGNGFTGLPSSSPAVGHKGLAPALTNIIYPTDKAYGADGNGDGKAPSEKGWVFDEDYLRELGWGGLLNDLDKRIGANSGP